MKFIGIIPSRYASTRFPGKPLADINGKSMIERVYEQSKKALDNVYVATDDNRIADEVTRFGGNVIMTSENHQSGTDRIAEAIVKIRENTKKNFDVVLNIQGDEPFIYPEQIQELISCFKNPKTEIATLVKKIENTEDIFDVNKPKVIFNNQMQAILFSRSPIPYIRNFEKEQWHLKHDFYKHVGMYAYKTETLKVLTKLAQSPLELAESLEQLRWTEHGYNISVAITNFESYGIDTPEDLEKILKNKLFD
ncbi:MAG: 3-deoxy-manno-octulosonate cytidylyltransferase [Bacteroidales bacterium]|jgi:3-deoxy-manno-octulosonate cytidylyltransferase (CMP-KDO synthetase)|nr:3-deoxy-manno-octulosonate cytidylyltransferase [Bacteroidales bacterium]